MPYSLGLAGSRHSSLRNKITPLPDFVLEALNQSQGRSPIPTRTPPPPPQPDQFDLIGGEAQLQREAEARLLDSKLNGAPSNTPTKSPTPNVNLSRSISTDGLARCLSNHGSAKKRLLALEAACNNVKTPPISPHLRTRLLHTTSPAAATMKKNQAMAQLKAKHSWGKLRSVVQAGFGMAVAAATTKAVESAMAQLYEPGTGTTTGTTTTTAPETTPPHKHKPRRVITPRMPDGRIVPSWQPPPNKCLPLLAVQPRDIALLRVCKIPREWAEQWLSGHDVVVQGKKRPTKKRKLDYKKGDRVQSTDPAFATDPSLFKGVYQGTVVRVYKGTSGTNEHTGTKGHKEHKGTKGHNGNASSFKVRFDDRRLGVKRVHVSALEEVPLVSPTAATKSAMSFEDARAVLPHSHTFLFADTGRFVTDVVDRPRLLALLRDHPLGPTPSTLREVVRGMKRERPPDGGPSGATFDRRLADGLGECGWVVGWLGSGRIGGGGEC